MYVYVCCFFPRSRAVMRNNVDSSNDKSKDLGGLITMVLVCVYQNPHLVNSWFELYYKQLHALNIIRTKFINIVDSSNCSCEKWEDTYHFFYLSLWNIIQIQAYHVWWIVRLLFMHVWFWLHGENLYSIRTGKLLLMFIESYNILKSIMYKKKYVLNVSLFFV